MGLLFILWTKESKRIHSIHSYILCFQDLWSLQLRRQPPKLSTLTKDRTQILFFIFCSRCYLPTRPFDYRPTSLQWAMISFAILTTSSTRWMDCLQTDGPSHFLRHNAPVASPAGRALLAMSTPPPSCTATATATAKNVKRYLINHLLSTILGGQCFVFLFCQLTEQLHQGDMNNPTSMSRR